MVFAWTTCCGRNVYHALCIYIKPLFEVAWYGVYYCNSCQSNRKVFLLPYKTCHRLLLFALEITHKTCNYAKTHSKSRQTLIKAIEKVLSYALFLTNLMIKFVSRNANKQTKFETNFIFFNLLIVKLLYLDGALSRDILYVVECLKTIPEQVEV